MDMSEATKQMHDTQDARHEAAKTREVAALDREWDAQIAALQAARAGVDKHRDPSEWPESRKRERREQLDRRIEQAERDRAKAAEVLPQLIDLRHQLKRARNTNQHMQAEKLEAELKALPPVPRPPSKPQPFYG